MGFNRLETHICCVGHDSCILVDLATGDVIDEVEKEEAVRERYRVFVEGFGALGNERVPVAGIWGGGLRHFTPDGWHLRITYSRDRVATLMLFRPHELDERDGQVLVQEEAVRAFGFSPSGAFMVVMTDFLDIWRR